MRTAEVQHVTVGVLYLESTQIVRIVVEGFPEFDVSRCEFRRQRIWIGNVDVGVPGGKSLFDVPCVIRHRLDADVLEHDASAPSRHYPEEDVVWLRALKHDVEPKPVDIKRNRSGNVSRNEERHDVAEFWFGHQRYSVPVEV